MWCTQRREEERSAVRIDNYNLDECWANFEIQGGRVEEIMQIEDADWSETVEIKTGNATRDVEKEGT